MFSIDLVVKYTPVPMAVQRNSEDEAKAVYQQILEAMQSGSPKILELTCDRTPDKKIAILSSEITAVQLSQKTGGAASGRPPGFFALTEG